MYARNGMLREFMQEYMLVASGSQGKPFDETMLRFQDVAPTYYSPRVVIMDPARTVEVKKSDQTGHVTVSKTGNRIFVHQSGGEYWQPDQIVEGAFSMSKRHDDARVGASVVVPPAIRGWSATGTGQAKSTPVSVWFMCPSQLSP